MIRLQSARPQNIKNITNNSQKKWFKLFIITSLVVVQTESAWGVEGVSFSHEDWTISCNNTGTCSAAGYQKDDSDDNPVSVLFTRKAGANSPVIAEVQMLEGFGEEPVNDVDLFIDSKNLGHIKPTEDESPSKLTKKQTKALLDGLKKDTTISFTKGKATWHLSDKGASAVLLKMDEFQQRIDTPSAIMRKGTSKKSVLQATPVPIIHAVKTPKDEGKKIKYSDYQPLFKTLEKQLSALGEDESCNIELLSNGGITYTLNAETKLLEFDCWQGAYNFSTGYALLDNSLKLKELLPIIGTDYHKGEISGSWKSRGLGDCWSNVNYVWTGKAFELSEKGDSGLCRGFTGGAWARSTFVSRVISDKTK